MSSPFQKSFNSKSPLKGHKKIQRQINILRNNPKKAERKGLSSESGGGIDYEAISRLEAQLAEAKAAHSDTRTEEGDSQVREDEDAARNSAAEMSSPLHGYREASDMVDSNPPTAHMWGNVFQSFSNMAQQIIAKRSTPEAKAKRLAKREARRAKRGVRKGEGKMITQTDKSGKESKVYQAIDPKSKFNKRSENVKNKKEAAQNEVAARKAKLDEYNGWLAKNTDATDTVKANKKESLGLT